MHEILSILNQITVMSHLQKQERKGRIERYTFFIIQLHVRDATQSPGKSPIFSSLKIGGWRGVNPGFGKIETKDSNCRDRTSVCWEN